MNKEEWIKFNTTGTFEYCNHDVINFIANIIYRDESNAIYDLFTNGYCYYFAVILKTAFNRGKIVWHRNHGHIVWLDDDGTPYDAGGPFTDYNEGDLLEVDKSLYGMIVDFKHTGEKFKVMSLDFHKWIQKYNIPDITAVGIIYRIMPESRIDDNFSVEMNAYSLVI